MDMDDEEILVLAIIHHANLMYMDSDEEEEGNALRDAAPWVKVNVDVDALRRLPDPTFRVHFRITRFTFEILRIAIGNHLQETGKLQRLRTPIDLAILMILWVLGNPDPFRSVALKFNVSPGVLHYHYVVIIQALSEMAPTYITWPSAVEREQIKDNFERRYGFPGVVGCIDSTHLYLTAPYGEKLGYVNRHHSHSILAQVVGDNRLLVRDLYAGEPGSLHDSRVFRRSPLSNNLLTKVDILAPDEHILGDGAYIITDKLLIPYRNNGHLTPAQLYFNRMLSAVRASVERTFRLAKGKWRRMKNFESHNMQYAVMHVVASFVLHNIGISYNDITPEDFEEGGVAVRDLDWRLDEDVDPEGNYPNVAVELDHPLLAAATARGSVKRRALSHYFETGELPARNN